MICTQPLLDVCEIMKDCHCRCLRCGLLGVGRGQAACMTGGHWDGQRWQLQWRLFEQKRGWTREKERGDWKMGLFFDAVLFDIVFWFTFFNAGWLISYQDQVNCWTGFSCKISLLVVQIWWSIDYSSSSSWLIVGYLLRNFSSIHPNLVITFLFGNYSVRVNCRE